MTRKDDLIALLLPSWKENVIVFVARCIGIKGLPVFLTAKVRFDDDGPCINDLKRNLEESPNQS